MERASCRQRLNCDPEKVSFSQLRDPNCRDREMVGGAVSRQLASDRRRSIGYLLLTLVVSVLVPLISLFSWQAIEAAREKRAAIELKRTEVARLISLRLDSEIMRYFGVMEALTSVLETSDGAVASLADIKARLVSDANISNVWPFSATGTVEEDCKAPRNCGFEKDLVNQALKGNNAVSGIWEVSPGDTRILLASPPRAGSGRRVGVIMELRPAFLSRLVFADSGMGTDWLVGVVDQTNHFVARSLNPERRVGGEARPELAVVAAGNADYGSFENKTLEGVDMANSFQRSHLTRWTTVTAVPQTVLEGPLRSSLFLVLTVSGAILFLTLMMVVSQARRIAESVRDLSEYAITLTDGRPFVGGAFRIAEFDAVRSKVEGTVSNTARFAAVAATSGDAIVSVSPTGIVLSWNRAAEDMFGYKSEEIIGRSNHTIMPPESHHELEAERARVLKGETFSYETLRRHRDGQLIEVSITSAPIYAPSGGIIGISSILRDIRQRKMDERHILDLMRELAHRSKNQIAIIQSIARKTAMSAESLEEFGEKFELRLRGLSITFDVLSQRDFKNANVRDLVDLQLGGFVDDRNPQLRIEGPDVVLGSAYIEALGLALHELATNAVKYGAWSTNAGVVCVTWSYAPSPAAGASGANEFELTWREEGGPAVVAPDETGFGCVILNSIVARSVRGVSRIEFAAEGVSWRVAFQSDPN